MIVSIANFFYYLFTGLQGHFTGSDGIQSLIGDTWKAVNELFYNLGGGSSTGVTFDISVDWFGLVSVILALVLVIGLSVWILKMIWRLFTLR